MSITNLRCNEQIRLSPIRLIDAEGTLRGVVPTDTALGMAREAGLDLVEVSPNERPPVCKIMDYGKYKYQQSKKLKQKHHEQKLKELRIRPRTDVHDKEIKLGRAREFLQQGHRVQFTMMFKGRERFHKELGAQTFAEITAGVEDLGKVERAAYMLGRRMVMVLAPGKAPAVKKPKPAKPREATPAAISGPSAAVVSAAVPMTRQADELASDPRLVEQASNVASIAQGAPAGGDSP